MAPLAALDLSCLDPPSLATGRAGTAAAAAAAPPAEVAAACGSGAGVPACFPLPAVQDVSFSMRGARMCSVRGLPTAADGDPVGPWAHARAR